MVSFFFDLSGRQSKMILAMNGSGIPMKNQGQNFLPKPFAICPARKGITSGKKSSGSAKTNSISVSLIWLLLVLFELVVSYLVLFVMLPLE